MSNEQLIFDSRPRLQKEADEIAMRGALRRDGYASYVAGVSRCPLFVDDDMGAFWRMGWHEAHGEHYRRKRCEAVSRCNEDCDHR